MQGSICKRTFANTFLCMRKYFEITGESFKEKNIISQLAIE